MDTHITQMIDVAEEKAQYDTEVKNILSDKRILAWIMSRVTEEFRDMPIEEIVQCIEGEPIISQVQVSPGMTNDSIIGRDTQDKIPGEGEARFDILFHAITPKKDRVKIIINVEAQKKFYPGYDLVTRGIYYGARLLSSQKERSVLATEEMKAEHKLHILEEEYHIATTRELEGKVNIMCNWSEGVIERVIEKVTERVTREVTEQVTQQVTEQVTEQVTQQVTHQMVVQSVENVTDALGSSLEEACRILKIDLRDFHAAQIALTDGVQ